MHGLSIRLFIPATSTACMLYSQLKTLYNYTYMDSAMLATEFVTIAKWMGTLLLDTSYMRRIVYV